MPVFRNPAPDEHTQHAAETDATGAGHALAHAIVSAGTHQQAPSRPRNHQEPRRRKNAHARSRNLLWP
eukprot:9726158-Alexandrium_andersonii.AAC.1